MALRSLRPPGTRTRAIPYGYGFSLVSCPNYFFEVMGWAVITGMTNSLAGKLNLDRNGYELTLACCGAYLFLAFSAYIMTVWALKKHRNYKKEFGKNYPRRKAMWPFIL